MRTNCKKSCNIEENWEKIDKNVRTLTKNRKKIGKKCKQLIKNRTKSSKMGEN